MRNAKATVFGCRLIHFGKGAWEPAAADQLQLMESEKTALMGGGLLLGRHL